ncbi:unnamed protein product, partial [Ixodes pacificus]
CRVSYNLRKRTSGFRNYTHNVQLLHCLPSLTFVAGGESWRVHLLACIKIEKYFRLLLLLHLVATAHALSLSLTSERHLRNFYPLARKEKKNQTSRHNRVHEGIR